jgi:uncharacterized SAM-binding protein YcdF (DUF218 family)
MSFFLSKFLWFFFNPFTFFLFLFFIGFFFLVFKKYKISFHILLISLLYILFISIFPIGKFGIFLLEKEFHSKTIYPDNIDGILILSGATNPFLSNEYNTIELNASSERLIESFFLINKYKNAKVIFSGGSGYLNQPHLDHTNVAKKFYDKMKIDSNKIIYENKSKNTFENILFSKELVKPNINENWLLITSAAHMRRALLISQKQNWKFIPYPVDFNQPKNIKFKPSINFFSNVTNFQKAVHEWLGLLSYYLMGRSDFILNPIDVNN